MLANGFINNKPVYDWLDAPYITNTYSFSFELAGHDYKEPELWIDKWFFEQPAPFKYRLLAKIPIFATYKFIVQFGVDKINAIYSSYMIWTNIFIFAFLFYSGKLISALTLALDPSCKMDRETIFYISTLILALSPPVLFAFKFPIHGSPNDFLGYCLISLSLLSLLNQQIGRFVYFVIAGLFCRETNLIVLIPFVFITNISLPKRIAISTAVFSIFLLYRLGWQGSYKPTSGYLHNINFPFESMLFIFMVFSIFWVLGVLGYNYVRQRPAPHNSLVESINKTFVGVTTLVFLIFFGLARVREIRLEFILFFYFIPYGLVYSIHQWKSWMTIVKSYKIILVFIITAIFTFKASVELMPADIDTSHQLLYRYGNFYGGQGEGWRLEFLPYLAITLVVICLITLSTIVTKKEIPIDCK